MQKDQREREAVKMEVGATEKGRVSLTGFEKEGGGP